ncbi:MAG: hypothetical protein GF416_01065 [Candidatus Altiarchaeales archaeon]|nr:hypothetical protein [Candidatus Altiarchaeales archaeon]MBD3415706.1 hypothetical protein [Candidatus Altiarchaeales archaeon]
MLNTKGYSGVLLEVVKSERMVVLGPILFINFFAVGYVLHGIIFTFKELTLSQIIISVTLSMVLFYGELIMLLIPMKVFVDNHLIPKMRKDRDIIRLSFDEQDREVFRRAKLASNSLTLLLTGMINYFFIGFFVFMWYSNDTQPVPAYMVADALTPFYGFLFALTVVSAGYEIVMGRR